MRYVFVCVYVCLGMRSVQFDGKGLSRFLFIEAFGFLASESIESGREDGRKEAKDDDDMHYFHRNFIAFFLVDKKALLCLYKRDLSKRASIHSSLSSIFLTFVTSLQSQKR
jgi:hypothetical protein